MKTKKIITEEVSLVYQCPDCKKKMLNSEDSKRRHKKYCKPIK